MEVTCLAVLAAGVEAGGAAPAARPPITPVSQTLRRSDV